MISLLKSYGDALEAQRAEEAKGAGAALDQATVVSLGAAGASDADARLDVERSAQAACSGWGHWLHDWNADHAHQFWCASAVTASLLAICSCAAMQTGIMSCHAASQQLPACPWQAREGAAHTMCSQAAASLCRS